MAVVKSSCAALLAAAAAAQQQIVIDWSGTIRQLKTAPTFQTVVNPLITRSSPIHDQVYASIRAMTVNATNLGPMRYVPWLPYPREGVAALEPPSGSNLCGFRSSDDGSFPLTLSCGGAGTIASVAFASYGTPTGFCGSLALGSCNANTSMATVTAACVGKASCILTSDNAFFGGDPCPNTGKSLAVQVTCSAPAQHTYWDFTYIDPLMEDFMNATGNGVDGEKGSDVIINYSTAPTWMYVTPGRVAYPDDPNGEIWNYEQGTQLVDPTGATFGAYYGRLLQYYTSGGFMDEYNNSVPSPYHYNISHWECLNEPEGEHGNSPQSYTLLYDSMVQAMRAAAPQATASMQFVGMALEGHNEWNWYNYFLNSSNHAAGALPLQWASMHFYASCSSRMDPTTYTQFFDDADGFITEMQTVSALRDALAPGVRLDVDECGVILPDDNDPAAPQFPLIYWNAAAAMYAYLFGQLALVGVDVVGESQLMGYPQVGALPPQFPSVSMLNWTTGAGTPRYWALKLLVDNTMQGDSIVTAAVAPNVSNPFCGNVINLSTLQLTCTTGVINKILFASYGTPSGTCPSFTVGTCNAANSTTIVESYCLGQQSCSVPATTPIFGDPCYGTVKYLQVVATCSSGGGFAPTSSDLFVQAYAGAGGSKKKLLVVNKGMNATTALLPAGTGAGATWTYVDATTGDNPPASVTLKNDLLAVSSWAVGMVQFA